MFKILIQVKDASGVRRPYNETGDAVNPAGDIEDPVRHHLINHEK